MKKERIYVLCTKKSEWADVLRYKAAKGHVWRQSQKPVLCNNENIGHFQATSSKGEPLVCLGIHEEGGETSLRVAKEKGTVISFDTFQARYAGRASSYENVSQARPVIQEYARPIGYEAYDGHFGPTATATSFAAGKSQTTTSSLINK